MTAQNQKRAPFLLGPNWQGASLARASAPQEPSYHAPSFHASLRECARDLEQRPETEPLKSAAIQQRESAPPQLHLTLLKHVSSWLCAKNVQSANKKLQVDQSAALEKIAPRFSSASRLQSGVLGHIWSWLQSKYASSNTKRLRVAEMVPLGEKRFLAVVCVEGREFLVGGGASGVSVVTQLDAARDTAIAPRRELEFQGAIE
jgi:hypothetical protein